MSGEGALGTLRFDVLLHELHIFKSRTAAAEAIRDGDALLDGARVKPSHAVRAGSRVTLAKPSPRTFEVLELPRRSLSKEAARALVREVGGR
jgi:ribosomal 50S subunit-recycling heat shock protein